MTITQRIMRVSPEAKLQTHQLNPDEHLASVSVGNMLGVLTQLGALSEFAADIFEDMARRAADSGARVEVLRQRVARLEQSTSHTEHQLASASAASLYAAGKEGRDFKRSDMVQHSLFTPATRPRAIQMARDSAEPMPPLALLDEFGSDPCATKYSDVGFFFEQWVQAEQERQAKQEEERKARKARKKKKKASAGPRRAAVQAEAVQVKTYSALGAEFDVPQSNANTQTSRPKELTDVSRVAGGSSSVSSVPSATVPKSPSNLSTTSAGSASSVSSAGTARLPPPAPTAGIKAPPAPPAPTVSAPSIAPPPPPPVATGTVVPPPPPVRSNITVPPAPPAVSIPTAPVVSPRVPVAPAANVSTPSAAASVGPARGGLLEQIRAGKQLRKVEPTEPKQEDARGGLLSQIRGGVTLKKVERQESKPSAPASGLGSIMAILSRRAAIEGSDSEDSEWEDDA